MKIARSIIFFMGAIAICMYTCAWWGYSQSNPQQKALSRETHKQVSDIDTSALVYPYYEWLAKDTAIAWLRKKDGSLVAASISGSPYIERHISGLPYSLLHQTQQPYGFKMSPDENKVLYLLGGRGGPAETWRVGTLNGTGYISGDLLPIEHWPHLVWKRDSKGWVGLVGSSFSISAVHYNINSITPPRLVPINDFTPDPVTEILWIREDGIAVVPSWKTGQLGPVNIYLVDIDRGRVLPGIHKAILPERAHVWEMCISHRGDRIAWLLHTGIDQSSRSEHELASLAEVWVSNSDGSKLQKLHGFAPVVLYEREIDGEYSPRILRWTKDDTAISYIQDHALDIVQLATRQ